jgi:hypothetical protein
MSAYIQHAAPTDPEPWLVLLGVCVLVWEWDNGAVSDTSRLLLL